MGWEAFTEVGVMDVAVVFGAVAVGAVTVDVVLAVGWAGLTGCT